MLNYYTAHPKQLETNVDLTFKTIGDANIFRFFTILFTLCTFNKRPKTSVEVWPRQGAIGQEVSERFTACA